MTESIIRMIADKWVGERCYLNGAPAKIVGRLNRVGTVAPLDASLPDESWSWPAINRIMLTSKYFETK